MFDPPPVRRFGPHAVSMQEAEEGQRRRDSEDEPMVEGEWDGMRRQREDEALAEGVMGLGLGLALGAEKVEDQFEPMNDGMKVHAPSLSPEIL